MSRTHEFNLIALEKHCFKVAPCGGDANPLERPPWYRVPDYKGNLIEAEKRELDAFRARPRHPAFEYSELSEQVEIYISGLETEAYDLETFTPDERANYLASSGYRRQ